METFSALLALCAGNSPVSGEFPAQRPVTRSFDVFFDLRLIKRRSKHSWGWWFETLSLPLWRHCNDRCMITSGHRNAFRIIGQLWGEPHRRIVLTKTQKCWGVCYDNNPRWRLSARFLTSFRIILKFDIMAYYLLEALTLYLETRHHAKNYILSTQCWFNQFLSGKEAPVAGMTFYARTYDEVTKW